jgi:selenocysteine lyase/cysteine desulfurase
VDHPGLRRLYFDNAATSSPKPPAVLDAMVDYARRLGGSPGRGAYTESREAGELMWRCRERICRFINGQSASHVIFALNTSDALNLAIKGLLQPFVHSGQAAGVVATWMEHNSVLRPLNAMVERHPGTFSRVLVRPDPATGLVDPADIAQALDRMPEARLVAVNHASNVTGVVQPVAEIGAICAARAVPLLVDAAQSLGHIPVDVQQMNIDLLAFPGHKGLLGPTGTGGLYIRPGLERRIQSVREGGTGSRSENDVQPAELPDKYEPGSQNAIGVIGLSEGVQFLHDFAWGGRTGAEALRAHELALIKAFLGGLERAGLDDPARGLRLLGPRHAPGRVGVFTITCEALDGPELSTVLESEFGVLTRSGIHCAPLAHRMYAADGGIGGGTRFSLGPFLSEANVAHATSSLSSVLDEATRSV